MFTQIKLTPKTSIPVFLIPGDPTPSLNFVPGECICKNCRCTDLTFYRYVDDAKCSCGQWQNEDLIDD